MVARPLTPPSASVPRAAPSARQLVSAHYARERPEARRQLWLVVIGFGIFIAFLVGWSLVAQWTKLDWRQSNERQLFERTRASWQKTVGGNK